MITSFEVGSVFTIVEKATPTKTKKELQFLGQILPLLTAFFVCGHRYWDVSHKRGS